MFIDQSSPSLPAPSGGAELKLTDAVQLYSAPPNGAVGLGGLWSINISPLRGGKLGRLNFLATARMLKWPSRAEA